MAYVTVPKDLTKVKSKVIFGLTKRQLICFSAAAAIGLPLFFLLKDVAGTTTAALCMVIAMLPMFLFAMYESTGSRLRSLFGRWWRSSLSVPRSDPIRLTISMTRLSGRIN